MAAVSTFLVVGASGATGRHVVQHVLDQGHRVKAVVRSSASLPPAWRMRDGLELIEASFRGQAALCPDGHGGGDQSGTKRKEEPW
jgi:uncharacterized protein YbjT (DUF2867 family)